MVTRGEYNTGRRNRQKKKNLTKMEIRHTQRKPVMKLKKISRPDRDLVSEETYSNRERERERER